MRDFEAAKGFEFEDDEVFCPFHLLTEDDVSLALPPFAFFSLYLCLLSAPLHPLFRFF